MGESGTDDEECSRKVASGNRVADAIRFLVNARSLQVECARVLHESLLVPVLTHGDNDMEGEGEVYDLSCTDGQSQMFAGYQENG